MFKALLSQVLAADNINFLVGKEDARVKVRDCKINIKFMSLETRVEAFVNLVKTHQMQ